MNPRLHLTLRVPRRVSKESGAGRKVPAACQADAGKLLQERFQVAAARKLRKPLQEIRGLVAGKKQPLSREGIHDGPVQGRLPGCSLGIPVEPVSREE